MKKTTERRARIAEPGSLARTAVFWLGVAEIVLVPIVFSTSLHRIYAMPKFVLLLTVSATLTPLLALAVLNHTQGARLPRLLASKHLLVVCAYILMVVTSTILGVAPMASLYGSLYNQMGLLTQLGFFICFWGLIVGIGTDQARFERALWAMAITGAAVATYACMQFFGFDPYLPQSFYTDDFSVGPIVRVIGTLGHSNYLGNFLLYTTPIGAALALASKGESRWLMVAATVLSVAAITFSGTRGAWMGIVAGGITFGVPFIKARLVNPLRMPRRRIVMGVAIAVTGILAGVLVIASAPAARGIMARARSVATEGFTGSGRTLLWRDAIKMVPDYAFRGCGPEGFRKAFLAYKSKELTRYAPQINNESSHNAYLDAAISYGLAGAAAYIVIIVYAFWLIIAARRRAQTDNLKIINTGLLASLVGVVVHNFFIYDQIATGLYFFALMALALVSSRVASSPQRAKAKAGVPPPAKDPKSRPVAAQEAEAALKDARYKSPLAMVIVALGGLLIVAAVWYSARLIKADAAMARAFSAASRADSDRVVAEGSFAARGFDPTGDYHFLFARALALCADRMQTGDLPQADFDRLKQARARVIELGITNAEKSFANTLTPDSSHLLVAYLALQAGDWPLLKTNASEAISRDPYYPAAHRLMAEAYLAEGDREQAAREAQAVLDIIPSSRQARVLLKLVRDGSPKSQEKQIKRGLHLAEAGRVAEASAPLERAIRQAGGPCPECHRALATVSEAAGLYSKAAAEWQLFIEQTPDRSAAEQARAKLAALRQKLNARP
jgi:O-antigen ligase/tetratricopeptide (TPR) repeat protein